MKPHSRKRQSGTKRRQIVPRSESPRPQLTKEDFERLNSQFDPKSWNAEQDVDVPDTGNKAVKA